MTAWRVLDSEVVWQCQWMSVRRDTVELGTGVSVDYFVAQKPDFAMVVALTPGRDVVLVKQFKPGIGREILECPAGYLNEGELEEDACRRELTEETGYAAGTAVHLGTFPSSPSVLTNKASLWLCLDCVKSDDQHLDATEDIEVVVLPLDEAISGLVRGAQVDLASTAALLLARSHLDEGIG